MSSDGAHEAALLYRTVPPTNKPAPVLILDGRERQLKQGTIDGLRFTNDGRLFYKLSGAWYGNDDRPAPDTLLADLNAPLLPVAPPAANHRITTKVEHTGFQQRATTIYVDGKSAGTYDEVLQYRGPTGPQSYHVLPDGSAVLYAFRGGAILRIVVH